MKKCVLLIITLIMVSCLQNCAVTPNSNYDLPAAELANAGDANVSQSATTAQLYNQAEFSNSVKS
jgi:hypothetical protein